MEWLQLLAAPQPVVAPSGIVFSTNPQYGQATNGHSYFLKGPATGVVFAEAVSYELAHLVGLAVPDCGLVQMPDGGGIYFASRQVRMRSAIEELIHRGKAVNPELLAAVVAFDVWVTNTDRNSGNVVCEPYGSNGAGTVKLYAIDFEKAAILAGQDRFSVTALPAAKFWPTGDLGILCKRYALPKLFCSRIAAMTEAQVDGVIQRAIWDLQMPRVPWMDTAVDVLARRATRIADLVNEVWND